MFQKYTTKKYTTEKKYITLLFDLLLSHKILSFHCATNNMTSNKMCTSDLRAQLSSILLQFCFTYFVVSSWHRIVISRKIAQSFCNITQIVHKIIYCNGHMVNDEHSTEAIKSGFIGIARKIQLYYPHLYNIARYLLRNAVIIRGNYSQPKRNIYRPISLELRSKIRYIRSSLQPPKSWCFSSSFPNQPPSMTIARTVAATRAYTRVCARGFMRKAACLRPWWIRACTRVYVDVRGRVRRP